MAGPAPAARPLAPPGHSAAHSGSVPPASPATLRGPSYRIVSPAGCAQGSRAYSVCARHSRRRRSFLRPALSAVSTVGAANSSSPGASTLRVGLIYRAVPALALPSIRCCVPWQVPHPPRDLWRRRATRRRTPGPSRPRAPATRRGPSRRAVSPAGCAQGSRASSVCARQSRRRRSFLRRNHSLRYLRWEPRTVLAPVPLL